PSVAVADRLRRNYFASAPRSLAVTRRELFGLSGGLAAWAGRACLTPAIEPRTKRCDPPRQAALAPLRRAARGQHPRTQPRGHVRTEAAVQPLEIVDERRDARRGDIRRLAEAVDLVPDHRLRDDLEDLLVDQLAVAVEVVLVAE